MSIRVGFIGLGNIGKPMAQRLVEMPFETTVFDLRQQAVAEVVEKGGRAATSCREVAAASDVIGICVRSDDDVRAVSFGSEGVLAGAAPGAVIAIHSTILPGTVHEVARAASERDVGVADAPVTGGAAGAARGTLVCMVGGEARHLERCRVAFEAFAAKIVHTGGLGSGAATKLCNNLMTYLGLTAAFEANLLATASGLSLEAFDEVTRSNGNMNDQMRAFLALHRADVGRDAPAFREVVRGLADLAEKDLSITLAFAREHGVDLPATARCRELVARVCGLDEEERA